MNLPPEAIITVNANEIAPPNYKIELDASKSIDDYENITYLWEQTGGPANGVTISNATSQVTDVTFGEAGTYTFKLTVTDDEGEIAYIEKKLTIIDMVFVEGGSKIYMGSYYSYKQVNQPGLKIDDFLIGKYEITQAQWQQVMDKNLKDLRYSGCSDCPAYGVDWYDAVSFCNQLSKMLGLTEYYIIEPTTLDLNNSSNRDSKKWTVTVNEAANGYRLPTEAEWEYAAKGGNMANETSFAGSNNVGQVAWYDGNSGGVLHPVGKKLANELGIFDLSGNVFEWCYDWFKNDYYLQSQSVNPAGPAQGSLRILRGGDWMSNEADLNIFKRNYTTPSDMYINLGFRIVKNAIN